MKTIVAAIAATCLLSVSYRIMFSSNSMASNSGTSLLRNRLLTDGEKNENNSNNNNNNNDNTANAAADGQPTTQIQTTQPQQQQQQQRPVMHTFFSQLHPNPDDRRKTTAGMTSDAHTDMIRTWKAAWEQAGWDTRVLTIDDAKQHPDYNFWDPTIQRFKMGEYDKFCFYRWIAMAAVGGGWMSDYDTLPLHNFTDQGLVLPHHGAFAVYGVFVPALLSGNASEWLRMIHLMVEYAHQHTPAPPTSGKDTPSDMMTLLGLMQDDPTTFISRNEVVGNYDTNVPWTSKEVCSKTFPTKMRAMHFSHYFIHDIWIPNHFRQHQGQLSLDDRGEIAKTWMEKWLRDCGRLPYQEESPSKSVSPTTSKTE